MSTPEFDYSGLVTLGEGAGEVCGPDGCWPAEGADDAEGAE
ncbi:hypothetical protein [Corynebacterium guangdongense]|uniref:Uncharacterized protein n=1 Tax=Corynebacterium guangdongense TaxID=1783348 RepID=A0ABU1ZVN6_9CORY|nr:hypothetical protein [Corynebacterium guangdongense]MDR7328997.1 hypothetical protein [Corynebacterium guangdongense]